MKKPFKKVIACLLAVLMVTLSMPFTALAVPGDYKPDVQLQFSTFCANPADLTDMAETQDATAYQASGLAGYPLQWDQENGTLTAKKEDINSYNTFFDSEAELTEEDYVLKEGDFFAVTIRFDNVDIAASGNVNIRFSDNLTPAGFYTYKKGTKWWYGFANENNAPTTANSYGEEAGFRAPIGAWSASELYKNMNDTQVGDLSCIQEDPAAVKDDGWSDLMMTATLVCDGDHVDVSSVGADNGFFDIAEGKLHGDPEGVIEGYTYGNQFIVVTFAFELTDGTKPIQFALQDPNGDDLNGAAFFAKKHDDPSDPSKLTLDFEYATTYAPNGENPGSMKMTFMGKNENIVTVTFRNADGSEIYSTDYAKGAEITAPELPATVVGDETHTTYAWDSEIPATATESATYQVVATTSDHTYDEGIITKIATCIEKGAKKYTCTVCDKEKTEETELAAHTPGEALAEDIVDATCTVDGSYNEVVRCTVCNEKISSTPKTIEKTGHKPGEAVQENRVESTCTVQGHYDEVIYCTVESCKEEISRTEKTLPLADHSYSAVVTAPTCTEQGYTTYTCTACGDSYVGDYVDATGHKPGEAVQENRVESTCTVQGHYDEVIYCTVESCKEEISRTEKTLPLADHSYSAVVTKPTCTAKGYTTYTCTACGDTYTANETAATGHKWNSGKITATTSTTYTTTYTCTVCKATKKTTSKKKANPIKASGKTVSLKYSAVKKKNQTVKQSKAFSVSKAQGKVTYKKSSGNSKITVAKDGKITVKKGLKKGTYKVKIKVTAAGNNTYKSAAKTVTVTIKVK